MSFTSSINGTTVVSGPEVIQVSDFYVHAGILHPVTVGSIAIIVLFGCLRLGSNRSIAPLTTFDWLINVALGSTLAGIVNGNSLVRGLLALATMLAFQYLTSILTTRFPRQCNKLFQSPPLVIAFRGMLLHKVMRTHRISSSDVYAALRERGLLNISQVECVIIEPNGVIAIITKKELKDSKVEPEALMCIPAYKALCEEDDKQQRNSDSSGYHMGIIDEEKANKMTMANTDTDALNLAASKCS